GLVSTYSASNFTTDSGAAATAMASGVKTLNQVVGVDPGFRPLETLADRAKAAGWKVGYVTDTAITHATPAAFYASVCNRYDDVDSIAEQLLEKQPDVAFGGGWRDFLPSQASGRRQDASNLIERAQELGYTVWRQESDLPASGPSGALPEKVLGLFAGNHIPYVLDDRRLPEALRYPSLAQLTETALAVLHQEEAPFFLMVEGGRIDHAAHVFDAAGMVPQVQAFDEAVKKVLEFQRQNPDTLVLITADHATGGLAINDSVDWSSFGEQTASIDWVVQEIRDLEEPATLAEVHELIGYDQLTEEDRQAIRDMGDSNDAGRYLGSRLSEKLKVTWVPRERVDIDNTGGHTGEDVPLYAQGPGANRFAGALDNTDIPRRLLDLLGWEPLNRDLEGIAPVCDEIDGRVVAR
ncbi:MAG: alkaline phosphatase, partial [Acidobacteria bacterium]|nr:alkaline phosphatase [Acidobacteriota bacterium]